MKTQAVVPAQIDFDAPGRAGPARSVAQGDADRPRDAEVDRARQVFLAGNGLPARWQGRSRFVVLETGFGLGHNFLATWLAWRQDTARCERLFYVAIEKHPPRREALAQSPTDAAAPGLSHALLAAWPPLTHDLHTLSFDGGSVTLLLALGDVATWLPELVAQVDAFYLDGFAPGRPAERWDARVFKACARLAAPDATAATGSLAREVHRGLAAAGFEVGRHPGVGGSSEMTVARLKALPRHPPAPGRRAAPACRSALVIGSGLAGASAAEALARRGLRVTVLERHDGPAPETSGNVAGLFHGVLHPQDGAHAQLLRAAALRAAQVYRPLIESGRLMGATQGLLRGAAGDQTLEGMRALLARQGQPPDYVQALDAAEAAALAACPVAGPAWFYAAGGWLAPAQLVRAWLQTEGVRLRTGAQVAALSRPAGQGLWQAVDGSGQVLARADVVVVAAAVQAAALLAAHSDTDAWTLQRTRGQVTRLSDPAATAWQLPRPRVPLASGGYLVSLAPELGGGLFCGATSQTGDDESLLRDADHAANLGQIGRLTGSLAESPTMSELRHAVATGDITGRVGWRLACDDRLPLLGPVPARVAEGVAVGQGADAADGAGEGAGAGTARGAGRHGLEQPRQVPRVEGLYLFTALGSRGITLAPLLSETLAAWITGAPLPLAASLIDAIDPARFVSRRLRRAARNWPRE